MFNVCLMLITECYQPHKLTALQKPFCDAENQWWIAAFVTEISVDLWAKYEEEKSEWYNVCFIALPAFTVNGTMFVL